ncbi:Hypothetical predicted protein [Octopus vulgaris]|uniref:Uncharacterized protein n=1 Tax=Octopus vulgaris TaxID=6645 RepID=A0AA36F849_OCTVU|nr:Hypothetical predicted protein [Octopus vulgaris]
MVADVLQLTLLRNVIAHLDLLVHDVKIPLIPVNLHRVKMVEHAIQMEFNSLVVALLDSQDYDVNNHFAHQISVKMVEHVSL